MTIREWAKNNAAIAILRDCQKGNFDHLGTNSENIYENPLGIKEPNQLTVELIPNGIIHIKLKRKIREIVKYCCKEKHHETSRTPLYRRPPTKEICNEVIAGLVETGLIHKSKKKSWSGWDYEKPWVSIPVYVIDKEIKRKIEEWAVKKRYENPYQKDWDNEVD